MLVMTLRGTALARIWLMTLGFQCELCDDESLIGNLAVAWHSGSTVRCYPSYFRKSCFFGEELGTGLGTLHLLGELHEL